MPVFTELGKIKGRRVLGRFNWNNREDPLERDEGLRDEFGEILRIVDAHEETHGKDYKEMGVNSKSLPR